jgi:hypothetical protein
MYASSVGIATLYGLDEQEGQEMFVFSTAFRPALGPIQSPVLWVPGDGKAAVTILPPFFHFFYVHVYTVHSLVN